MLTYMCVTERDSRCLQHLIFGLGELMWIFCILFSPFNKPLRIFIHMWSSRSFLKRNLLSFFWWHILLAIRLLKSREIFSLVFEWAFWPDRC